MSGEQVEANAAVRTVTRAYLEATATLTQIGSETVTTDEQGRHTVKATFIQLTSASYTPGTIGTTAAPTTTAHPKMDITNGRSMELFRQIGLAQKIRDAGNPGNANQYCSIAATV